MKIKFKTDLSQNICKENISHHAGEGAWYTDFTSMFTPGKEIEYTFKDNTFQMKKIRPYLRNPLQVTLFGEFIKGEGTTNYIIGRYRMNRFGVVFMIFWEALVIAICLFILVMSLLKIMQSPLLSKSAEFSENYFALLIPLVMPIFGYVFYTFGKEIAKRDIQIINTFIERNCKAELLTENK